jgi:hypothetical protein
MTAMRATTAALALLALAACGGYDIDDPKPDIIPVEIDATPERLDVEVPAGAAVQYLPWAVDEDRALGAWTDSLDEARAKGAEYQDKHPQWAWTLLWRQKPDAKPLVPRY